MVLEQGDSRICHADARYSAGGAGPAHHRWASRRQCFGHLKTGDDAQSAWRRWLRVGGAGRGVADDALLAALVVVPGLTCGGWDTPHWRRCRPSFLNQVVQVGTVVTASGFPLDDGHAQQLWFHVPGVEIRLKKIPRLRSNATGGVLEPRLYLFIRGVQRWCAARDCRERWRGRHFIGERQ